MSYIAFKTFFTVIIVCGVTIGSTKHINAQEIVSRIKIDKDPRSVAIDDVHNFAYVTNENSVSEIDIITNESIRKFNNGGGKIFINPLTGKLYIANGQGIDVININMGKVVAMIPVLSRSDDCSN